MKRALIIINLLLLAALTEHVLTLERMLKEAKVEIARHEDGLVDMGQRVFDLTTKVGSQYDATALKKSEPEDREPAGTVKL